VLLNGRKKISTGCPGFPFIGQGKDLRYMREREREIEKEIALGLYCPSPPRTGLAGPVDDNEGMRVLWLHLSPVL
jgi:hypothetical protein